MQITQMMHRERGSFVCVIALPKKAVCIDDVWKKKRIPLPMGYLAQSAVG
jgi:hypothetical protein